MTPLVNKFEPQDVIAVIVIVGGLALKFSGADGLVGTLLTAIVFYYFGKKGRVVYPSETQSELLARQARAQTDSHRIA